MVLYTINNHHPDKNFALTITASDLSLAASTHSHQMADIVKNYASDPQEPKISDALAAKSPTTHTHTFVREIFADEQQEEYDGGVLILGATATSGSSTPSLAVSNGSTVSLTYYSPATNLVGGFLDQNPATANPTLEVYSGPYWPSGSEHGFISLEENEYA